MKIISKNLENKIYYFPSKMWIGLLKSIEKLINRKHNWLSVSEFVNSDENSQVIELWDSQFLDYIYQNLKCYPELHFIDIIQNHLYIGSEPIRISRFAKMDDNPVP